MGTTGSMATPGIAETLVCVGKDRARAHAWFTAEPVNLTPILAKAMKLPVEPSGQLALLKAGFRIEKFQDKRVIIERLR